MELDCRKRRPAKLSDQPEREPLDDLAHRQFQLHARSRPELDRDLCRRASFHRQRQLPRERAQTLTQRPLLRLEEHLSRNATDALWLSADAYYNLGGGTSIDGIDQDNMANTLRIGAGMGMRLWRGADVGLNYERVVAKTASEPYSQTVRLTVRQLW